MVAFDRNTDKLGSCDLSEEPGRTATENAVFRVVKFCIRECGPQKGARENQQQSRLPEAAKTATQIEGRVHQTDVRERLGKIA